MSAAPAAAPPGPLREFWSGFGANRGAVAGLAVVLAVLALAAFAPWVAPHPPDLTNNAAFLRPPAWSEGGSWTYPLGTDAIGRDILSRLIHGGRTTQVWDAEVKNETQGKTIALFRCTQMVLYPKVD